MLHFAPVAVLFSALLAVAADSPSSPYPPPPFTPPAGHPRVYFTAKDLPRIREWTTKEQNALAWKAHLENLKTGTDGQLRPPADPTKGNINATALAIIESYAFDCALRGNEEHGRRAIAAMHNYLKTLIDPDKDYNTVGQLIFTIAIVYDWCYPLLTDADRQTFIATALDHAAHLEIGYPPTKLGNVTGHGPEGQLMRDLMAAGIAMYDERPDIYQVTAGRFFSRMVEPRRFMYPAHMHHQGSHYTTYRGEWEMLATWMFDRMGLPQVFGPEQQYFMYWILYARRGDGQILRDGDTHINNEPLGRYYTSPSRPFFLAANYFNDPYLKMEAIRERPNLAPDRPRGNQSLNPVELLVFNNPDLEPKPLSDLPLTKYFPSPKGAMIARTGWEDGVNSSSAVVEMKINEWYFANHQHLDAGAFQIFYRGVLANDSGYYQAARMLGNPLENDGSTGYGSLYDVNYYKRSVAHNVITVYDPDERFSAGRWKKLANDGGQRMPNNWNEAKDHANLIDPANGYRIGEVLGHGFGPNPKAPDYTYLKGDLTKAYSSKIKAYERSFVFLNLKDAAHPGALIVFDRVVSAKPEFRKAWLLHALEEPSITGNRTVVKDTRKGYTGKLTVDTLLPEGPVISTFGGPGKENWVDGTSYLALTRPTGSNEGGGWRIEVSPKTPSETDYFLHILQLGDHTPDSDARDARDTPALPAEKIETTTHIGARLANHIVLFAKSRDRVTTPISFTLPGPDVPTQFVIADLAAGEWTIERNGQPTGTITVSPESGTASFRGPAGVYRFALR